MRLSWLLFAAAIPLAGCDTLTGLTTDPDAPANVTYELMPSGDPTAPSGVLLSWDVPASGRATSFNIYGRNVTNAGWQLRATTTSTSFHDVGVPEAQYYVSTRDASGQEIAQSEIVDIDLTVRLPAPAGLTSTSLNGAVQLAWSRNVVDAAHGTFDHYRVYSASYDVSRGVCRTDWVVEGSTVSDGFLSGNLTNGVPRCFAISGTTLDGHETPWSASRVDTPRYDAHNVLVYANTVRPDSAGFYFFDDTTQKVGVVGTTARTDVDVTVERHVDGSFWFTPGRTGVTMMYYSGQPINNLTSIDAAAATGFGSAALEAQPGFGYVFRVTRSDGVHFAAMRVVYVGQDWVVLDWSYQSAVGSPELSRLPRS